MPDENLASPIMWILAMLLTLFVTQFVLDWDDSRLRYAALAANVAGIIMELFVVAAYLLGWKS